MSKKERDPAVTELKNKKKYRRWFKFLHFVAAMLKPVFPFRRYGRKQKYDDRNYIFIGNHRSMLDIIPVGLATRNPVHFIAKKELWDSRFLGWFATKSQAIPVGRDGNDVRAVMSAIKYLKNGETVAIFPEGKRNKTDEELLPLKSGAAALAIRTKTPVVPVVALKRFRPFIMHKAYFGEPVELSEFYDRKLTEEDMANADEEIKNILLSAYNNLKELTEKKKKKK